MAAIKEIPLVLYGQDISGIRFAVGSTVNFNLTCLDPDTRNPISLIGANVIMSISSLNLSGNPSYPPLISRQADNLTAFGTCTVPIADGDTSPTPTTAFKPGLYGADVWLTDTDGNRLQLLGFVNIILTPAVAHPGTPITPLPSQQPLAQGPAGSAGTITCTSPILVNGVSGPVTTGVNFVLSIAAGGVTNAMLLHPSLTVTGGTGLTGGGTVALGGSTSISMPAVGPGAGQIVGYANTLTLDAQGRVTAVTTAVPTGSITGTAPIKINGSTGPVNASNDITVSIASGGVTNAMLQNSAVTVTAGSGLTGGGAVSLGGSTSLSIPSAGVTNAMLVNSSMTLAAGNGLSGLGVTSLGGSATVDLRLHSGGGLSKTLGGGSNELGIPDLGVVDAMIDTVTGSKVSGDVGSALSGKFAGLNVKDYGAVGNNSTDNVTPFTNAIAAAESRSIGTVYIPAGTYKFSTRLGFTTSDIRILGQGRVTLTSPHYTVLEFFSTCSNVTFENIAFETTYVDSANLPWGVVQAFSEVSNQFSLSNIKFINCEFTAPTAAEAVKLINNTTSTETFTNILFDGCNFHDIGRGGLICQNTLDAVTVRLSNIVARNCSFSNLGLQGNVGTGQGVSFGGLMTSCVVDGCYFSNPEYAAIEYTDGGHGQITNNRFAGWQSRGGTYYRAISITDADSGLPGMVITGNQEVESSGQNTTWFIEYVSDSIISNNVLLSSGIYLLSTSNCNISNNFVNSIDHYALFFDSPDSANNKISGNKLSTLDSPTPFSVIRFSGAASVTENIVTDNDVYFAGGVEWDEITGATGNIYYLNRPNSSSSIVLAHLGPTTARQHTVPSVASDTFALLAASQALTNKTISGSSNTLSNIANASLTNSSITATAGTGLIGGGSTALGSSFTLGIDSTVATLTGSQVLTNKTLTTPVINGLTSASGNADFSGSSGTFKTPGGASTFGGSTNTFSSGAVGPASGQQHTLPAVTSDTFALLDATQTLTNKTISGGSNTLSNIANASLTNSSITATAGTGLSGTATVSLGGTFTFAIDSTVATLTGSQTLTNKTISGSSNTLSNIANASLTNSAITATAGTGLTGGGATSLGGSFTLGIDSTVATLTGSQTLTNKTLTTPIINGLTSASGNADFSGSSGSFKTTAGASTLGGSSTTVTNNLTLSSDLVFAKEGSRNIAVNTSTTTSAAGGSLEVNAGAGAANANGGQLFLHGGTGGSSAVGGVTSIQGGAAGSGGTAGSVVIADANTSSLQLGASGITTAINGLVQVKLGLTAAGSVANDFSGSSGAFKTSTGAGTYGGSSNTFTNAISAPSLDSASVQLTLGTSSATSIAIGASGIVTAIAGNITLGSSSSNTLGLTAVVNTDLTFVKEVARTISIATSTTASTVGAALTASGAGGSAGTGSTAGAAGGAATWSGGTGGVGGSSASAAVGGSALVAGGTGGASAGSGAGAAGGALTSRGGTGGAGSGALAGGAGGAGTVRGGTGGAGTATGVSGNGGAISLIAGAAGSNGGGGAGTNGVVNVATSNSSQLNIAAAGIPIQIDGYLTLGQAKKIGTLINSASTIAPTAPVTHVDGTTTIQTITAPTDFAQTGVGGTLIIIPDGLWVTNTAGNIAIATTAVVSKALIMTYDSGTSKWYPSY